MRDTELYRQLLGLASPWTVTRVELAVKEQRVDVWAGHSEGERWPCPECGALLPGYDHTEEREWRHLDSCQFKTYLHARPPRVQCAEHGVRQVRLPWAEERARFTTLFERLAIDVLLETDVLGAARILRITWDEAWHIQARAVRRGQQAKAPRVVTQLGVDQKAAAKGHRYLTLVCDLQGGGGRVHRGGGQGGEPGLVLHGIDRGAAGRDRSDRPGHVGAVHPVHPRACARRRQQDGVRSLSHHGAHGESRGHGPEARAPSPEGRGRRDAHALEIPVGVAPGE